MPTFYEYVNCRYCRFPGATHEERPDDYYVETCPQCGYVVDHVIDFSSGQGYREERYGGAGTFHLCKTDSAERKRLPIDLTARLSAIEGLSGQAVADAEVLYAFYMEEVEPGVFLPRHVKGDAAFDNSDLKASAVGARRQADAEAERVARYLASEAGKAPVDGAVDSDFPF